MEAEYSIYVPADTCPDLRHCMTVIMRAEDVLMREYGKFATRIVFNGETAHFIKGLLETRKINLGAEYVSGKMTGDSIELEYPANVRIARGDVIHDFAFHYTIEKEVKPTITINIVKL